MDIKILKIIYRNDNVRKNYYIKHEPEDENFDTFKNKIFERMPDLKEKRLKIFWTGNLFSLVGHFDLNQNNFAMLKNLKFIFISDEENDDIHLVTQEDFAVCLENNVTKIQIRLDETEDQISRKRALEEEIAGSDSSKRVCVEFRGLSKSAIDSDILSSDLSSSSSSDSLDSFTTSDSDSSSVSADNTSPTPAIVENKEVSQIVTITESENPEPAPVETITIEDDEAPPQTVPTSTQASPSSPPDNPRGFFRQNDNTAPLPWQNETYPRANVQASARRPIPTAPRYNNSSNQYSTRYSSQNHASSSGTCLFTGPNGAGSIRYNRFLPRPGQNNLHVQDPPPRIFRTFRQVVADMHASMPMNFLSEPIRQYVRRTTQTTSSRYNLFD